MAYTIRHRAKRSCNNPGYWYGAVVVNDRVMFYRDDFTWHGEALKWAQNNSTNAVWVYEKQS